MMKNLAKENDAVLKQPLVPNRCLIIGSILWIWLLVGCSNASSLPNNMQLNANIPESEMSALYDLYNATNGANWLWSDDPTEGIPWNFTNPAVNNPCVDDWQGIQCDFTAPFEYYHVVEIALPYLNLEGTLPSSLDSFSELRILLLYINQLSGPIPASLGNLANLQLLELDTNYLSGPIPDSMGNLTQMVFLDIFGNQLTGTLPESLNQLTLLEGIYISSNLFDGPIPSFSTCTLLEGIYLFSNELSGSVPESFGHLPSLKNLEIHLNRLTGTIPQSLGLANQLTDLRIDQNELSGTIPGTLSNLTLLQNLNLGDNNINGTLPTFLGSLYELQFLSLYSNQLSGFIPEHLGNLTYLTSLDLYYNYLSGTIPNTLAKLTNLEDLSLYNNQLSGPIPNVIGNLSQLLFLSLQINRLTGTIPESVGDLSMLQNLILANNFLSQTVPTSLGNLVELIDLDVHENMLSGPIPSSLGMLAQLESLYISNNYISGPIPASLGDLEAMYAFSLNNNQLTGSIPSSIGSFAKINYFNLCVNYLNGTVPQSLGNMNLLQYFAVNQNMLTGTLPASLGELTSLLQLFLYSNFIRGAIPDSFGNLIQLQFAYLYDNQLTGSIPASLGNLVQLSYLYLYSNHLTGTLPESLSNLVKLQDADFDTNRLSGTLPPSLGKLVLLEYLDMGANLLTGSLPNSLGNLVQLQYLGFSSNHLVGTLPESLGNLTRMKYLFLYSNGLSGYIPESWGNLSSLQFIYLFANHLTGIIPNLYTTKLLQLQLQNNALEGRIPSLKRLPFLQVVLLHSNVFSGTLDDVFDPATQTQITTVTFNNNQLSGTLPKTLFQLKPQTFVGTSNCFEGPLPMSAICSNMDMISFVIDGMSSATACRNKLFAGSLSAYTLQHFVGGSIPTCLFQLPNLTTLHLSGNGFTGSIPGDIQLSDTLSDLSLSHNALTGTIPEQIQHKGWSNIDLSYNRLSGTLSSGFASNESIELENNRLSGRIPDTFLSLQELSVLGSNTFRCSYEKSDLPEHDPGRERYHCGSNSFDVLFYIWLGIFGVAASVLIYSTRKGADSWLIHSSDPVLQNTQLYTTLSILSRLTIQCTIYTVVVLLPLYSVSSVYYSTQTYEYAYQISAVYMSGVVPFILDWIFWTTLVVAIIMAISIVSIKEASVDSQSQDGITTWALVQTFAPYLLLDCIVVAGVNAAYVYVAVYKSSSLLLVVQTLLSIFKVVWGRWALPFVLAQLNRQQNYGNVQVVMQIIVNMLNNIAIPCLVVAVVSPNCFYNALVAAPTVTADVFYENCLEVQGTTGNCVQYGYVALPTFYDPPFTYNYQCSASLVTYYSPAFVSMCIVSTFGTPLVQYFCQWLYRHSKVGTFRYDILDRILPKVMKNPSDVVESLDPGKGYLNINGLMTTIVSLLGLVVTFGVVFPPLCVAFAVTIFATVGHFKINVSRFTSSYDPSNVGVLLEALRAECHKAESLQIFNDSVWILVAVSCWFYTLFLFDTLGDAVGFEKAYWVLIVMPLMPLVLFVAYFVACKYRPEIVASDDGRASNIHHSDVEVEMKVSEVHNVLVVGTTA